MIRLMWIGGNHPRHLFFINKIMERHEVCGAIVEMRENLIPQAPNNLAKLDKDNFIKHFNNRLEAEQKYFGSQSLPDCKLMETREDNLNSDKNAEVVKSFQPDVVLIFGSGLIKGPLYNALPKDTINLHLGLSPRYRGSATLFWPFYFLEPNHAGSTFHYIVSEPDAGYIIHQVVPKLEKDDKIHDVACKTVIESTAAAIKLLEIYEQNKKWDQYKQKGTGKNFLSSDFIPQHLRVIYNTYNDDIVKYYLEGKLKTKKVNLISQF